jgi:hypothetical protein
VTGFCEHDNLSMEQVEADRERFRSFTEVEFIISLPFPSDSICTRYGGIVAVVVSRDGQLSSPAHV